MQLSYEKISHISNLIVDGIIKLDLGKVENRERVYQEVKRTIIDFLRIDEVIDEIVRNKINSYSRKIVEGSREWDVMYRKFYEEELSKRK
jgi:hypothetical protein